jgi:hypothetical protein
MRKWKPNSAEKAAYKQRLLEKGSLPIINSGKAIRTGCYLEYYSMRRGEIIKGTVIKHSYSAKNQHTFTILATDNEKIIVKGRNLYPNLLLHIQGEESIRDSI